MSEAKQSSERELWRAGQVVFREALPVRAAAFAQSLRHEGHFPFVVLRVRDRDQPVPSRRITVKRL
jgi:hypothetical protein